MVLAIVLVGSLVCDTQKTDGQTTRPEHRVQNEIDREKAIQVAQEHATKAHVDTSRYVATACEVNSLWSLPRASRRWRRVGVCDY